MAWNKRIVTCELSKSLKGKKLLCIVSPDFTMTALCPVRFIQLNQSRVLNYMVIKASPTDLAFPLNKFMVGVIKPICFFDKIAISTYKKPATTSEEKDK
ncbi:MAG: hypothetical protein N2201_00750 [candidate division WOR-3 bacterium]|nr:hypothetical protein [candidate division WOR-3 bacterium]